MKKIAVRLLNVTNRNFTKQVYFFHPPTFSAVLNLRINIFVHWAVMAILEKNNHKEGLRNTKLCFNAKNSINALVLGNGPTVRSLNFPYIKELILNGSLEVFTVNYGLIDDAIKELYPTYLLLSDEKTMPNSGDARAIQLWKAVSQQSQIRIITPINWHQRFALLPECNLGSCLHFVDSSLEGISTSTSPLKARGYASMTAYKALAFAIHLGYERIFCAGMDNSNFKSIEVNSKNRLIQHSRHLYSNYSEPVDLTEDFPNGMTDYLASYATLFYSLRSSFANKRITNLAKDSELDIFPKISKNDTFHRLVK